MAGFVDALVIGAVVALVVVRQFRAAPVDAGRRWWLVPGVLAVMAVREPGLLDAGHRTASAVLLGSEVLVGLVTGAGWAWTTRMWVAADGVVWCRSGKASAAVWGVGVVLRVGLIGIGAAIGVHPHSSALMLSLAATLLVRSGVVAWRAQWLDKARESPAPYGDETPRYRTKERV
ncbi:DUF1453 domain-containing protein [Streptomyces roseirectus]|uniref:DUF1453 domain-containing protein n=1 Tax=Streptomyces roseirectus TaxID=2768066 RepID=A0A7H0IAE5_9ACTN|nr:DUF1453 domain-containing protein [Streptomyces roseirectus]QNP69761.1 DUF1453 domain-containing protein [Streptomyces roseirectus]